MLIYCAHAYGGYRKNLKAAERKIAALQYSDRNNTYVSPLHAFGWAYGDVEYEEGMRLCLDLLAVCDELLILSGPSKGVVMELNRARRIGMPVRFVTDDVLSAYADIDPGEIFAKWN